MSSLLATSHALMEQFRHEVRDTQLWMQDTRAILEIGEKTGALQHRVKFQVGGAVGVVYSC